ncbi:MAG: ankyrin repeat domain-containing protein [Candidatus Lindowbacteria bacterium]|nr:ankyrin repeat domain-containing protein [Candidatus Lindowbacteria bacterium]
MLENGARVNARDGVGQTALHFATNYGHSAASLVLLSKGAPVNARDIYGITPLYNAASEGLNDAVRELLSRGARVNLRTVEGSTALRIANTRSHLGRSETIRLLEAAGGDEGVYVSPRSFRMAKGLIIYLLRRLLFGVSGFVSCYWCWWGRVTLLGAVCLFVLWCGTRIVQRYGKDTQIGGANG